MTVGVTRDEKSVSKRVLAVVSAGAALTLGLGACGNSGTASTSESPATTQAGEGIVVSGQWARATAPGAQVGAVYGEITSRGEADALVGATVPADVAAEAQIHVATTTAPGDGDGGATTSTTGSHMDMGGSSGHDMPTGSGSATGMQQVPKLEIPPGATLTLAPGGNHIMLVGLARTLVAGERIQVTLQFEKAPAQTVDVEVRES